MCLLLKPCVNRCLTCKFILSIQVLYISYMNVCILYVHGFLNCKPYLFRHFGYLPTPHILPAINFSSAFLLSSSFLLSRFSAARFLAFQRRALNSSNENSSMPQQTLSLQYMGTNTPPSVSVACRRFCSGSVCLGAFLALRSKHTL